MFALGKGGIYGDLPDLEGLRTVTSNTNKIFVVFMPSCCCVSPLD